MRIKNALVFFFVFIAFCSFSQSINEKNTFKINSEKSLSNKLEVKFNLSDYSKNTVITLKGDAVNFVAENSSEIQLKGAPGLPKFAQSIIVGENTDVKVLVKDSKYIEIENILIAPSKGVISRDKNPSDIPFEYGEYYSKDAMFPGKLAEIGDKYILRDFTGQTISVFPFQYNPVTKVLRVYTDIVIELSDEKGELNNQTKNIKTVNTEFNKIYEHHFLNYGNTKYTTQEEEGNMLVVCHTNYLNEMQSFVDWKNQRGLKTEMVEFSTIGTTATQLETYIKNYYNTKGLTYLLLVGDSEHIPSLFKSGDSDAAYGHILGTDSYAEVFVGRFSAQSDADVLTQVQRTIYYEKEMSTGAAWLSKAIGIASDEGGKGDGDDGESDIQHMNNIRTDLLTYGYNSVEQIYDPGASASTVATKVNGGVGLIDYVGHGSDYSWGTTGFSTSNVGSLTNENMLPFIFDVACVNGNFHNKTCFAESWLRASKNSNPTGAIAIIASTINQSWSPPMDGQDEMIDILIESYTSNIKRTFGGITVNGIMHMIDAYGSDGPEMADTWTIFGDPSLLVRTKTPTMLTITTVPDQIIGANSITVTGDNGAFVSLTKENTIIATGKIEGGIVTLEFDNLTDLTPLTLTATAFNKVTYIDEITVIPSTTPYVIKDNVIVNDATENNSGTLEFGETATLNVQLKNLSQTYDAFEVNAKLLTSDANLQILDSDEVYGTIEKDTVSLINDAFQVEVETGILDQTQVDLTLQVTGKDVSNNPYSWNSEINFTLNAPKIEIGDLIIDDSSGDNDGILDPGESATLKLVVENNGHASISGLSASASLLGDGNSYVTINTSMVTGISLDVMDADTLNFNVTVESLAVNGQIIYFAFQVNDLTYDFYTTQGDKEITIGPISNILISHQGTVQTSNAYFYDSGGNLSNYLDNENYSITFTPANVGEIIQAEFLSFDIESQSTCNYDYLKVYDGLSTSSTLIGTYCGTNSPGSVLASNASGALTFAFKSDSDVNISGWKAKIKSTVLYNYNLTVYNENEPMEGATVEFYGQTIVTGTDGVANFENIPEGIDRPLLITANGYEDYSTTIDMFSNITDDITLIKELYQIKFITFDKRNNNRIPDAEIQFLNQTVYSNENGEYDFNNLEFSLNEEYTITKENYIIISGFVDINSSKNLFIALEVPSYNITFVVFDAEDHPIKEAKIDFNTSTSYTNSSGVAIFTKVLPKIDMEYVVSKSGYNSITETIDVYNEDKTVNLSLTGTTSVEDVNSKDLMVYPNPSQGIIHIDFGNNDQNDAIINVYNVIGKSVYTKSISINPNSKETIDLSDQAKGVYFINIKSNSGKEINKKIIIK